MKNTFLSNHNRYISIYNRISNMAITYVLSCNVMIFSNMAKPWNIDYVENRFMPLNNSRSSKLIGP